MMKLCQKVNLQEPQRNRNATAIFFNLIMTSTVKYKQTPNSLSRLIAHYKATVKSLRVFKMI